MKGKLLFDKIKRPSIVFALGVLVVLFTIAFFVHLHVKAVNTVDHIHLQIDSLVNSVVNTLKQNGDQDAYEQLEKETADFFKTPGLNVLFDLYPEIVPVIDSWSIESDTDIYTLFNRLVIIEDRIASHTRSRESSFRFLYLLIIIVIVIMFLLLGVNQFENYKNQKSEKEIIETNEKLYDQLEKERSLLAFELHDDIAQKMAVLKRYFSSRNSIDEHTNLMEHYTTDVIRRVRYLSRMLKAPDNPNVSFKEYLETLFSDFNVLSDYKLNRKTVGLNALRLTPFASLHIYRIIQEILTNSRIHSEATEIDLLLVYSHPTLAIKYKDNGKGFDPYLVYRKGIGLDSIRYRLDLLKGDYRLNSAEGEGTDISIDIPVDLCRIS